MRKPSSTNAIVTVKICFCFPYKYTGGVSDLFVLLAKTLHLEGYQVCYIDYRNGAMHRRLSETSSICFIEYSDEFKSMEIDADIVILQSTVPWTIYVNLSMKHNTKVMFWNCHPENLILRLPSRMTKNFSADIVRSLTFIFFPFLKTKLKNFVLYSLEKKSLLFMDGDNAKHTFFYNNIKTSEKINYLPIPVEVCKEVREIGPCKKEYDFFWAGRVVSSKCHTLIAFAQELNKQSKHDNARHRFLFVGEGQFLNELKSKIGNLKNIEATFLPYLPFEDLKIAIKTKADVFLASGTLALIGGSLKVPTVLLDIANHEVPECKFNFMHETKDFSLGAILDNRFDKDRGKWAVKDLIKELDSHESKVKVAENCHSYVSSEHDVIQIVKLFLGFVKKSEMTWGQLHTKGFLKRSPAYDLLAKIKGYIR